MDLVVFLAGLAITVGVLLRLQKKINAEYTPREQPRDLQKTAVRPPDDRP
ncbi:MAG: hypothetical protein LBM00_02080 [Deltaproteobacteria bacterium]|jgi:hypothetical protein|nr:hypothetical protein [Deltaproteobacteria bacterium]